MRALAAVLGRGAPERPACGSARSRRTSATLEAAAGIAGLIKVVLALSTTRSRPTCTSTSPVRTSTGAGCRRGGQPRGRRGRPDVAGVAGVSSFGFSGTNAHVIVEEAPAPGPAPARTERPLHLVTLSARSPEALRELAASYADAMAAEYGRAGRPGIRRQCRPRQFAHRAALTAASAAEAVTRLRVVATGGSEAAALIGRADPATGPDVAFLFTGQGSQYVGMGRQLYEHAAHFSAGARSAAPRFSSPTLMSR